MKAGCTTDTAQKAKETSNSEDKGIWSTISQPAKKKKEIRPSEERDFLSH